MPEASDDVDVPGGIAAPGYVAWFNSLLAEIESAPIGILTKINLMDTMAKTAEARLVPWALHAQRSGSSWTEIGTSVDASKQVAHRRYLRKDLPPPPNSALMLWGLADEVWEMADPALELADLVHSLAATDEAEISRAAIARLVDSGDYPEADALDADLDEVAQLCEELPDDVGGQVLALTLRRLAALEDADLTYESVESAVRASVTEMIAADRRREIQEARRDSDWTSDW